jgi:multicomponent Na+:H+ antiporter subunit G
MGAVLDALGVVLLMLGLLLATIGLYGLLRMPDVFHQVHPAGLVTGPAVILILLASVATRNAEIITSAVLVVVFLLITSPLAGHAIAQAARRRGERRDEDA